MGRNLNIGAIIAVVIALLLVGILLPIGLTDIIAYNGSYWSGSYGVGVPTGHNSTMATLVATIVPIMVVLTIILAFMPRKRDA